MLDLPIIGYKRTKQTISKQPETKQNVYCKMSEKYKTC